MPVQCICLVCNAAFSRKPREVRLGHNKYCSCACQGMARRKPSTPVYSDDGLTAQIPILNRDGSVRAYAIVDAADAEWASQWAWGISNGYARRGKRRDGKPASVYMHCELLGKPSKNGLEVDHISRNRLDNRRKEGGTSSPYRGVYWHKILGIWRAQVTVGGRKFLVGDFTDVHKAGDAAKDARTRLMTHATD
jgi:hypothetical protein